MSAYDDLNRAIEAFTGQPYQPSPAVSPELYLMLEDYSAMGETLHEIRTIVKSWADSDHEIKSDETATLIAQLLIVLHEAGYR